MSDHNLAARLEQAAAEARAAAEELRETIREAHEARRDLRQAWREAQDLGVKLIEKEVERRIAVAVEKGLAEYAETLSKAMADGTQHVIDQFDRFGETLLGKEAYWQRMTGRRAASKPTVPGLTRPDAASGHDGA